MHTDEATYDIQFGNLTRKIHENTSWDMAKFEVCGHKWADLSEGNYGVSLMNDCKYGFSMKHRVMTQTLIKSGTEPNPHTDQEEHFFTYSLYPHAGTWKEGGTVQKALNLNVKARAVKGAAAKENWSFLSVDKANVVLETVKKAEDGDGIIVRLYEVNNSRTPVTLASAGKALRSPGDRPSGKSGRRKKTGGDGSYRFLHHQTLRDTDSASADERVSEIKKQLLPDAYLASGSSCF